jgi:FkbM family methyltransferase
MDLREKLSRMLIVMRLFRNWPVYFAEGIILTRTKQITYVLKNGIKFCCRPRTVDRGLIRDIWRDKSYTPAGFEINSKDIILDVGAHIGVFSVFAAQNAREGVIYSFEPMRENFLMLKNNLELNKIENVVSFNKALYKNSGYANLALSENNTGGHSLLFGGEKQDTVQTISLADFCKANNIKNINFLKMDCEGAEFDILFNCPNVIIQKIDKISLEYHNIDLQQNVIRLKSFLKSKGFEVKIKPFDAKTGLLYAKASKSV